MRSFSQNIRRTFYPKISRELQREIDKGNVRNMYLLSIVILCLETVVLVAYIVANLGGFGSEELGSTLRVCLAILICAVNLVVTDRIRRREAYRFGLVTAATVADFVLVVGWSIFVSRIQHARGEQYIAFYSGMLCFICFISYRPIIGCVLTAAAYTGLWLAIRSTGGAAELNPFNYVVLAILTAVGMITRYDQQIKVSRSVLELQALNKDLHHASRHDALTGLANRQALTQDLALFYDLPITVILTDIDYFKQVNDTHGHAVGDRALREAGSLIQDSFPGSLAYRYGGDEFLIISRSREGLIRADSLEESRSFSLPIRSGSLEIRLSFGAAEGTVANEEEFIALLSKADARLYEVKRRVHAEDDHRGIWYPRS